MGFLKRLRRKKSVKQSGSKDVNVKTHPTESSSSEEVTISPLSIGPKEQTKKVTFGDVVRISSTNSRPIIETQDTDNLDEFFNEFMQEVKVEPKTPTSLSQHSSNPSRISSVLSNDSSNETFSTDFNSNGDESSVETCKSDSSFQYLVRYLTCQPRPESVDVEEALMTLRDDDSIAFTIDSISTDHSFKRKKIDWEGEGRESSTSNKPTSTETHDSHDASRNKIKETALSSFVYSMCGFPGN